MQGAPANAGAKPLDQQALTSVDLDLSDVPDLCPEPPVDLACQAPTAAGLDLSAADLACLVGGCGSVAEPFQLPGDPYAEADDVLRGCTMPPGPDALSGGWAGGSSLQEGDWFYGAEREGCCVPVDLSPSRKACAGGEPLPDGEPLPEAEPETPNVVFPDSAEPREPPLGRREATSVLLEGVSAAEAAACVHTFLVQEVKSRVHGVKPEKLSMKADVFDEDCGGLSHCALKARVFAGPISLDGGRRLLVEFQRRRGDPIAFGRLFGRASQYILGRLGPPARGGTFLCPEVPPAPPAPRPTAAELELQPLVDMLADSSLPAAQAEAVSALVAVATASGAGAIAVCAAVSHLQGALAALVASTCLDVAYPAARLAAVLASSGGMDHGGPLLLAAREGVRFAGMDSLVRSELREACRVGAC